MGNERAAAQALREAEERNNSRAIRALIGSLERTFHIVLTDPQKLQIHTYEYLRSKLNSKINSLEGMQGSPAARQEYIRITGNYIIDLINEWDDGKESVERQRNIERYAWLFPNPYGGKRKSHRTIRKSRKSRKTQRKYRK